ncbi:hypothetical protein BGZ95_006363 [Linnemannia exigua]|uniref:Uncharacterized protein n=1 Tax=Linnemannia exigua TaxID=604196 RepID=A0AAD4H142_9FUNG|nr:hypothetical protein BGZ95_006363 [Linnemannia exigua]
MAQLNPIVYIPPTFLLLAILGIGIYTYQDRIQDHWRETVFRLRNYRQVENDQENEQLTEAQIRELYGDINGDIPEELLREFAQEDEEEDEEDDEDDDEDDEDDEGGQGGGDEEEEQGEVQPQGSTTSARLRMHHEMVQQMRARAGFAPEPFPGDVVPGGEGAAGAGDGEQVEDDGGVGSSQGATATGTPKFKRVGKKKAEKLERKNQMRAYHEFMEMQRNERRQQEEMFRIHDAAQQEERQRKRTAQLEKERKRKEQLKEKEAKEIDSKRKQLQAEKLKEENTRRELRAYIQRVKSFNLAALAKRLDRTEAQLLKDLSAIAQDSHDQDVLISFANNRHSTTSSSPSISTGLSATSSSSSSSSSHALIARQHLLVLFDSVSDQYVILDKTKLEAFAAVVQAKGRVDKKELSAASQEILCSSPLSIN